MCHANGYVTNNREAQIRKWGKEHEKTYCDCKEKYSCYDGTERSMWERTWEYGIYNMWIINIIGERELCHSCVNGVHEDNLHVNFCWDTFI